MSNPLAATPVVRVFSYNGRVLPDPDPELSPERVKTHYATIYPDLTNATVSGGGFEGGQQVYAFQRSIGTKG
jgi:PRTRC genetic system protein C